MEHFSSDDAAIKLLWLAIDDMKTSVPRQREFLPNV
jgi:hypothetical protein